MADSIIVYALVVGIALFGLGYVISDNVITYLDGSVNTLIGQGMLYQDAVDHYKTMVQLFKYTPFAFIVGTMFYMFERAKGTQITTKVYFEYIAMLIIGTMASIIFVYGVGVSFIYMVNTTLSSLPFTDITADSLFAPIMAMMMTDINFIVMVCYYVAEAPGYISVIIYCIFPVILQTDVGVHSVIGSDSGEDTYSKLQQY